MRRLRVLPLFWRVFAIDVAVLALVFVLLVFAPVTVSIPIAGAELAVLAGGLAAMLALTFVLLRPALRPLVAVTTTMRRIDPLQPGQRVPVTGVPDVAELAQAFNEMLERLEVERRTSGRRALSAQEDERRRVARELHDEVGQIFTAMMLQIETLADRIPPDLRPELEELRETARAGATDVRGIAARLRPQLLDDLGLQSALNALVAAFADQTGLRVERRIAPVELDPAHELVVYRVAQEALTNVARHAAREQRHRLAARRRRRGRAGGRRRRPRPARRRRRRLRRHPRDARAGDADRRAADAGGDAAARDDGAAARAARGAMTVPLIARVLIADDHPIVRDGVRRVLEARPDFTVVAEAADGATAVERAVAEQVDLAVLDVAMPGMSGLQAARELAARRPSTRTLMLSMYDDEEYLFDALAASASGYVLKTSVDRDLVEACRAVHARRAVPLPERGAGDRARAPRAGAARRAGARRPADAARARDRRADRAGAHERRDRGRARDQREDGRAPPREHPRQARDARPRPADPLRRAARD